MKNWMKFTGLIKGFFVGMGMVHLARFFGRGGHSIPVLAYHSISENAGYCIDTIAVSPHAFERQIAFLQRNYQVISLDEAVDCIAKGKCFPHRSVVITFDDGYLDNYTHAFPILKKYEVTATFYVTVNPVVYGKHFWVGWLQYHAMRAPCLKALINAFEINVTGYAENSRTYGQHVIDQVSIEINRAEQPERQQLLNQVSNALGIEADSNDGDDFMMSSHHIKEMAAQGMTIGSHTLSHAILSSLTDSQAREELENSRIILENLLKLPVKHISYPNGPGVTNFNRRTQELASEAGYQSATTSVRGAATMHSNLLAIERQGVSDMLSHKSFIFKLEEHHFKMLLQNTGI